MDLLTYGDIFVQVCNYLINILSIIRLESLSKHHKVLIRTNTWMMYTIKIKHQTIIEFVVENYNFKKYNFGSVVFTDKIIHKLKNCHTLDLSCTKITDESVCYFENCHKLNLAFTNITDAK